MSILKRFKITPSVQDPEGIFNTALVIVTTSIVTDETLPELPHNILLAMYQEAARARG